ncbi:thioredoxin-like domain-containing protein [Coprobacter sp.]|uniref:thioredoxin-like domain-containing protein n=1 Tax=Coprobacter sp. TaxID=1941478 RepID=UPI003AB5F96B
MKNIIIFVLSFFLFLTACSSGDKYVVKGNLSHLEDQCLYAVHERYKKELKMDTIRVQSGKFELTGESEMLTSLQLYTEDYTPLMQLFVKNGDHISLEGDVQRPFEIRIKGNETYQAVTDFNQRNSALLQKIAEKRKEYYTRKKDSAYFDDLKKLEGEICRNAESEISAKPASLASIILMYEYLLNENTAELCDSLLRTMPSEAKPASLLTKIDLFIEQVRKMSIGKTFPYSVLKNEKGESVSTNTFRDIPTIVTWWASYDPVSREEMKNIREIYSKYKDDKIRVVNISLDVDKENWKNRIKTDSLEWIQLIQPEEWNASSTRNLGISKIPYTVIIDKTGRLEKVGLEGDELKKYIDEMVSRIDSLESVKEKV